MSNSYQSRLVLAQNSGPSIPMAAQSINRYQSAKCTSDLFCLSNNKELVDFKLLLSYFDKPDYAIYCKKYSNLREICEKPNQFQQQRNEIRVKDVILFTRDIKFWKILKNILKKRKLAKLTQKGIANPSETQKRVTFSPDWTTKSKHNSMMISTQDNGLIICWNCYLCGSSGDLCSTRKNNYSTPHDALSISTSSMNIHYSSDGHKTSTSVAPSEAVMSIYASKLDGLAISITLVFTILIKTINCHFNIFLHNFIIFYNTKYH